MADYRLPFTGEQVEEILTNATPQSSLTQETQRATEAAQQLQSNINQEAETRGNADLQLQQSINTEAETRGQADLALQQLIQHVQASLINYYLKTETYSATQIDAMLAAIKQFRYQVVDELPTPSAETMGIIYLVPSAHAVSGNIKDEYITLTRDEGSGTIYYFEQIGETAIDLSNYYTKAQTNAEITAAINAALAAYYTSTQTDAAIAAAIATAIANYYTKSQVDALIANFITASVNNLVNYYLKSETFTKAEVNQLIAAVQQFTYQSVTTLPTASADTMNKIYLVPSTNPETKNVKDEYITIAVTDQGTTTYSWEQIGSTTVDLSGYYTSQQTDAAISNAINTALASYSTTTQMTAAIATAIANYYTKAEVDALIANFITKSVNDLVNYYLKSDTYTKAEVQQLIAAVQQFTYQSVAELPMASADTMNKIYLVPSTNPETKNVKDEYITISVTDQGTTTYSWEQIGSTTVDLSGYYTSAQTDAAITAAINTALADYSTTTQMTAAIATAIANYYTKAEVDALIANFITKAVNDLTYYYLKTETYSKAEVDALVAAIQQFRLIAVNTLPTASAETLNKIYLVPSSNPQTQNVKDEYITLVVEEQGTTTYSWECIGSTEVNLTNYYTKSQTDSAITAAINAALADYSTTSQVSTIISTAITTALTNYYTKTEVDNIAGTKTDKLKMTGAGAATENNFMAIDANGNIKDSGKNENSFQTPLVVGTNLDSTPTANSNHPVTSGGVKTALDGKQAIITDGAQLGLGYGVCSTDATTPAKTATIQNFLLLKNMPVSIRFTKSINVDGATLNISSTGAKPLFIGGAALQGGLVKAGCTITVIFDGTNWNITCIEGLERPSSQNDLFVDMGLPSGLLWAIANIDVTTQSGFAEVDGKPSPFKYEGTFFSWGNNEGHNPISASAFSYDWGSNNEGPYALTPGSKLTANAGLSYDAARAILGSPWRDPSTEDFAELFANIDYVQADGETVIDASQANKLVTVNSITGIYLKSKINGKLLFFPCSGNGYGQSWSSRGSSGYYWSRSLLSQAYGRSLIFYAGGVNPQNNNFRFSGFARRAVQ